MWVESSTLLRNSKYFIPLIKGKLMCCEWFFGLRFALNNSKCWSSCYDFREAPQMNKTNLIIYINPNNFLSFCFSIWVTFPRNLLRFLCFSLWTFLFKLDQANWGTIACSKIHHIVLEVLTNAYSYVTTSVIKIQNNSVTLKELCNASGSCFTPNSWQPLIYFLVFIVFFRISQKWNNIVCNLLSLACFPCYNAFEIHPWLIN